MFEKPSKLRPAILGGLIIGLITGLPAISFLNKCCCCGGVMLCGMLSLYLYKQEFKDEMPPLESSDALVLGIIAGLAGALIGAIIGVLSIFIFGPVDKKIAIKLLKWAESQGTLPPDALNKADEMIDTLQKSIDGGIKLRDIFADLLFGLILYPIFSMIGGLIGYGIFGKKKPAVPPVPPTQQ
jgi:hypothetical protein